MLDEFALIDTRSEALPIVSQVSQTSNDVGLRRGSVAHKEGQRVGRNYKAARTILKRNGALVSEIKKSNHKVGDVDRSAAMAELQDIRDSIDNIDASIIHMLAERFRCTQKVGVLKARHNLPPSDPGREAQQVTRLRELASAAKLDPEFAEKFFAFVIREVIRHHETARRWSMNARCQTAAHSPR
jgi:chorismate mutase